MSRLESAREDYEKVSDMSREAYVGYRAACDPAIARKSSRHNCPICGRWLDTRLRCAKVWSDGEGGWEHD